MIQVRYRGIRLREVGAKTKLTLAGKWGRYAPERKQMEATIYTTKACASCLAVKRYLNFKGIPFTEKFAESPEVGEEAYRLSGVMQVPVTVIMNRVIRGANFREINEALAFARGVQTA